MIWYLTHRSSTMRVMKKIHSRIALPSYARHVGILITRGLEKESLRVDPEGHLALTKHPQTLGSALTHPSITTDYAESLLEFITHPHPHPATVLPELARWHQWVLHNLEDEILWPFSMPCRLPDDAEILIAQYGTSHLARLKEIYREGLGHRYGKKMQMIAGIHFNVSFSDEVFKADPRYEVDAQNLQHWKNKRYFDFMRQFLRYGWLIPYLFGASPFLCRTFLDGHRTKACSKLPLETWNEHLLYAPHGTSLRQSPLGYRNETQGLLNIQHDTLENYVRSIRTAIQTPHLAYEKIGVQVDGHYRQLSTHILQIENEYYAPIRPKNRVRRYEKPATALLMRGVQYVEIRTLDLDPFEPMGISLQTQLFMEILSAFCILSSSAPFASLDLIRAQRRFDAVVMRGRQPRLTLEDDEGAPRTLKDWGTALMDQFEPIALLLEEQYPDMPYRAALEQQYQKFQEPERTPSAQMLQSLHSGASSFSLNQALNHARKWREGDPIPSKQQTEFKKIAEKSWADQQALEEKDRRSGVPFDRFLQTYLSS